jgi:hypothetical protein
MTSLRPYSGIIFLILIMVNVRISFAQEEKALEEISYELTDSTKSRSKFNGYPYAFYYSTNKQYKISMNNAYYFFNNKLYFNLPLSYGYFVDKFWGIGDNTETTGQEPYKMKTFTASMTIQVPPIAFLADRTGLIIDYNNTEIVEKDSNNTLRLLFILA